MPNDPVKNSMKRLWATDWLDNYKTHSDERYFLLFGRTESWGSSGNTDQNPPLGRDTTNDTFGTWRDAIGAKRIKQINAFHVIPKYDWVTESHWDEYDPDTELFRTTKPSYEDVETTTNWPKQFYALTNEYNVYVCISNAGSTLQNPIHSTVQPSGTTTNIISTSDGYRWKFLYKIPEDLYEFMTDDYIPIRHIESLDASEIETDAKLQWNVQAAAVDGRVEHIDLIKSDPIYSKYTRSVPHSSTQCRIGRVEYGVNDPTVDDGSSGITGGDVRAELVLSDYQNAYSPILNYYVGYSVVILQGAGAGQVRHITGYNHNTKTLHLDRKWYDSLGANLDASHSTYSIVPKCEIRGDGQEIEAVAELYHFDDLVEGSAHSNWQVLEKINMISGGRNYTTGTVDFYPRGMVSDSPEIDPTTKVMIAPKGGHGYNPVLELGAKKVMIVVTLSQDEDGDFNITNDYRSIGIIKNPRISHGGASGAGLYTGLIAGKEQPVTTILTIDAITGNGTRLFTDSSFLHGQYIMGDRSHSVAKIKTFTYDLSTKSFGLLTVQDVSKGFIASNADGSVTGEAINTLSIKGSGPMTWTFITGQSLATVRSATPYVDDANLTYKLYTEISIQATSGQDPLTAISYPDDTKLVGEESKTTGVVLKWTAGTAGTTGTLHLIGKDGDFIMGENIYDITLFQDETSDDTYTLSNAPQVGTITEILPPELQKGSGEMIYIQNIRPVLRSYEQDEDIKIVLGF